MAFGKGRGWVGGGGLSVRSRPGAGTMHKLHVEDISQVLAGRVDKVECGPESVHMRNVIDQKKRRGRVAPRTANPAIEPSTIVAADQPVARSVQTSHLAPHKENTQE